MKKILQNKWVFGVIGAALGLLSGSFFFKGATESTMQMEDHSGHQTMEQETITYTCSMHPQIRQNEPGSCPICGMDLVPLNELGSSPVVLEMTEESINLGKIETSKVELSSPEKKLFLQGKVKEDERLISLITARFGGRIEKLFVDFTGMAVAKGQKLATIYSPELVTAQKELFEAIKYKESNPILYTAARNKLRLWDITDQQIDEIESGGKPQTYLDVLAPHSGIVTTRHTTLGQYVKEGSPLFEVVDLSRVWVLFDAYESDLPWLKLNDKIEFTVASLPGEKFAGRISFIDPVVDATTRSVAVRLVVPNPGSRLKPEMFVNGIVEAKPPIKEQRLIIPKSAVLWTGTRAVVYTKVEDVHKPSFLFREIELGPDLGTHYVVDSGLNEGEEVVSNGSFKVDAAAQLAGKNSMMNEANNGAYKGKVHAPESFKQQLTMLFNAYISLKNELVNSDPEKSSAAADVVQQKLSEVQMHLLEDEAHDTWMKLAPPLKKSLKEISGSGELESQRKAFIKTSEVVANAVEIFGVHGITVYKDYCPMADGNKGAHWLSEMEEIRNPYFGEKMLKCGEVKKVFNAKGKSGKSKPMSGHNH